MLAISLLSRITVAYLVLAMQLPARAAVPAPIEYGNRVSWWIEYPSGLVDLTRTNHLLSNASDTQPPPLDATTQFELPVDGNRTIRVNRAKSAFVIIDMQNFFLNPALITHPLGLACVNPVLATVPALRSQGFKILWVNWGLTETELTTIPPSFVNSFYNSSFKGSFGAQIPGNWGRLLMRDQLNSQLYGPLQDAYLQGLQNGTDLWIHKNRLSGLWGPQTALHLYLEQYGFETLLFAGVNTDQCVLGTLADACFLGYNVVLVKDTTATTSPPGGYENVVYNVYNGMGFTTDSATIVKAASNAQP